MTDLKLWVCSEGCEDCRLVEEFLQERKVAYEKTILAEDRSRLPVLQFQLGNMIVNWSDGGNRLFINALAAVANMPFADVDGWFSKHKTGTRILIMTDYAHGRARALLERIAKGESVSVEERFDAIHDLLVFSVRDWSKDEELDILHSVAVNDGSEDEEEERKEEEGAEETRDLDYICLACRGNIVVVREENGRKIYKCGDCKGEEIWECTVCHKPRTVWADDGSICATCGMTFISGRLPLTLEQIKGIAKWTAVV